MMSGTCQNEVSYGSHQRDLQKTGYYDQQAYQGYYPGISNGYGAYDGQYGYNMAPTPPVDAYSSSCLIQGNVGDGLSPQDYNMAQHPQSGVYNPCLQGVDPGGGYGVMPAVVGAMPPVQSDVKPPTEIYPWMRESRNNTTKSKSQQSEQRKQQRQQQQQQQQQQPQQQQILQSTGKCFVYFLSIWKSISRAHPTKNVKLWVS